MGSVKCRLAAFLLVACTAAGAFASGFETSAVGVKGRAMSGAFRAIADDWTAAYYNPAGYAFIYDNQFGANAAFVHHRHDLDPDLLWRGVGGEAEFESGVVSDRTLYNFHEILSNPSGGIAFRLPIWGESVLGFSIYQPFDYNVTWELFQMMPSYNDSIGVPGNQYVNNIDVVAFQVTFGREFIEDELAIGVGLQLLRADLLFNNLYLRDNPIKAVDPGSPLVRRPADKIIQWANNDGYGFGFGITVGGMYQINEDLKMGVTAKVPFDITVDGNANLSFIMPYNPTLINFDDTAGAFVPGQVSHLFASGANVVDTARFETDISLPPSFGIGFAYELGEKLTLALDAEYTLWSQFEGYEFAYTEHGGLTGPADTAALARDFFTADLAHKVEWDNAGKVSFGAMYDYSDLLTFMLGAGADQSPARNWGLWSPQFNDTGDKYTVSGGVQFSFERWDVGLAGSFTTMPTEEGTQRVDLDGDGELDNMPGVYGGETFETVLSVIHRF